ncbi:NUMOD4 domain-containing protein [Enterococcus faecalis]|uniref:NUMOD4 domain-containing protein n=1 Tax=Enterococcus faecalis TaxID=1351 RepID=UPI00338F971F
MWKSIKDYCEYYEVSSQGDIRSKKTGKILKPYKNGKGYLIITLSKNGKNKKMRVHRLVAQAFLENPNNLPDVNHKDYDRTNNCVSNLEWMGRKENVQYSSKNGNFVKSAPTKRSTTGVRGVSWSKEKTMWRVRIYENGKRKHIGYFKEFEQAVIARKEYENKIGGIINVNTTTK